MANFPKAPPAIGRSTGLTGLQGATGAAGAGTISGVVAVDSLSGTPRSVSDWGALINTAIGANSRCFMFGPYDYPFTTTINGVNIQGLTFAGAGGWDWYDPGRTDGGGHDTGHTRLIWNGTGSGFAIDFSSTATGPNGNTGPVLQDLMLLYSSASYTGVLVKYGNSTMDVIERCFFGSVGGAQNTAKAALSLDGVNTISVNNTTFGQGLPAVRGRESPSVYNYSNIARFTNVTFAGGTAITNPGLDWRCDQCDFEFPNLPAGGSMITTDFVYTGDAISLTLDDCAYWDAGGGTQRMVYAPFGNAWDFAAVNCHDQSGAGSYLKLYDFQTRSSSIRILGGNTFSQIDVGDARAATQTGNTHTSTTVDTLSSPSTITQGMQVTGSGIPANTYVVSVNVGASSIVISQAASSSLTGTTLTFGVATKRRVQITGCDLYSASTTGLLLNANTGHQAVDVDGNSSTADNALGLSGEVKTLAHERAQFVDVPAVVAHAGVTNHTFAFVGNDMAGFVVIHNGGGGTGPTGLLADITLAVTVASTTGLPHKQIPLVECWPFQADDGNSNFFTGNMTTYYACQPYSYAKTLGNSGAQNAFSLGVNVGIPAGGTITIGYRVVHL